MSGGKRNFLPNVTDNVPNNMGVLQNRIMFCIVILQRNEVPDLRDK